MRFQCARFESCLVIFSVISCEIVFFKFKRWTEKKVWYWFVYRRKKGAKFGTRQNGQYSNGIQHSTDLQYKRVKLVTKCQVGIPKCQRAFKRSSRILHITDGDGVSHAKLNSKNKYRETLSDMASVLCVDAYRELTRDAFFIFERISRKKILATSTSEHTQRTRVATVYLNTKIYWFLYEFCKFLASDWRAVCVPGFSVFNTKCI